VDSLVESSPLMGGQLTADRQRVQAVALQLVHRAAGTSGIPGRHLCQSRVDRRQHPGARASGQAEVRHRRSAIIHAERIVPCGRPRVRVRYSGLTIIDRKLCSTVSATLQQPPSFRMFGKIDGFVEGSAPDLTHQASEQVHRP